MSDVSDEFYSRRMRIPLKSTRGTTNFDPTVVISPRPDSRPSLAKPPILNQNLLMASRPSTTKLLAKKVMRKKEDIARAAALVREMSKDQPATSASSVASERSNNVRSKIVLKNSVLLPANAPSVEPIGATTKVSAKCPATLKVVKAKEGLKRPEGAEGVRREEQHQKTLVLDALSERLVKGKEVIVAKPLAKANGLEEKKKKEGKKEAIHVTLPLTPVSMEPEEIFVDPAVLQRLLALEAELTSQKQKNKEMNERREEKRKKKEEDDKKKKIWQREERDSQRVHETREASVAERSVSEFSLLASVAAKAKRASKERLAEVGEEELLVVHKEDDLIDLDDLFCQKDEESATDDELPLRKFPVDVSEEANSDKEVTEHIEEAFEEANFDYLYEAGEGLGYMEHYDHSAEYEEEEEKIGEGEAVGSPLSGDDAHLTPGQVAADQAEGNFAELESEKIDINDYLKDQLEEEKVAIAEEREFEEGKEPDLPVIEVRKTPTSRKRRISEVSPSPFKRITKRKGPRDEEAEKRRLVESQAEIKANFERFKGKPFLSEQGFDLDRGALPNFILHQIESRGWSELCAITAEARQTWVIEFYASILDHSNYLALVRQRIVRWAPKDWNDYLGLEDVDSEYDDMLREDAEKDMLSHCVEVIGVEGANWEKGPQSGKFLSANLNEEAKIWANFVKSSLMPTTHESSLTLSQALLIYAIMTNATINVGNIIASEISAWVWKKATNLIFPHLVTGLCMHQGVRPAPGDLRLSRRNPIHFGPRSEKSSRSARKKLGPNKSEEHLKILKEIRDEQRAFHRYFRARDQVIQKFLRDIEGFAHLLLKFPTLPPPNEDPLAK